MRNAEWQIPATVRRVTVRLDDDDLGHMESIRRAVVESSGRAFPVGLGMSYADTIRYALAVACRGQMTFQNGRKA